MKAAVPYDFATQSIFGHFGKTEFFRIYTIENGKVEGCTLQSTNGQGHGAIAALLTQLKVDAVICGGIGEGARNALAAGNIEVYAGYAGSCDAAAQALAEGKLAKNEAATCSHHHGDHEGCGHKCC